MTRVVLWSSSSELSGAELMLGELGEFLLDSSRVYVTVATSASSVPIWQERFPSFAYRRLLGNPRVWPSSVPSADLHVFNWATPVEWKWPYLSKWRLRRYVSFVHLAHIGAWDVRRRLMRDRIALMSLRGSASMVAPSTENAQRLRTLLRDTSNISVIRNIPVHHVRGSVARNAVADGVNLLFVGRLQSQKRPDRAIRLVSILRSHGESVQLDVLGDGPERTSLEALAADLGVDPYVAFHGYVNPGAFYGSGRIFLVTSDYEGGGIAQLEALYGGSPVVGTRVGGMEELVEWFPASVKAVSTGVAEDELLATLADALTTRLEPCNDLSHPVFQRSRLRDEFATWLNPFLR